MKYIEKYLKDIIKVKPLGTLTTKEDELDGISGEMVYIGGKCSNIFISRIDYANWLEKQVPIDEEKVLIGARKDIALSIMNFLDRCTTGMCLSNMECADLESAVVDSDWSKVYDYMKKKLDKQGKQKSLDYENINIQQKDFAPKSAMEAIKEEKIDNTNKVEPKDYNSIDPHFGKPTDKVEPKFYFSVGQWIVATGKCVYLITKIDGFNVTLVDVDGNEYVFDTSSLEDAHLWTIQDAKDGDVLFHSDSASNGIFIFKEIIDKGFAKEIICYCDYDSEDHFCLGEHHTCCWADAKILHPATKEQRDTLEKAMADAGYTFDFEKKELKKIEESENIKNQIMSEITDLVKDYITQKPAKCSEEEELSCFESALFTAFSDAWQSYLLGEEVNVKQWTKEHSKELLEAAKEELKGHNSAWSEEDEYTLNETIQHLKELIEIDKTKHCACDVQYYQRDIDWLKTLKDRIIALANRCSSGNK